MGTAIMCFLASSTPLRMASGTSPALPRPAPTRPWPSPTTTSALKEKRRPPFTTLATRLRETIFSWRSPPRSSRRSMRMPIAFLSEPQSGGAGRVGQRADPAVVQVAAAVEDDLLDALLAGTVGDGASHELRRGHAETTVLRAQVLLHRGGGRQCMASLVVDELDGDVPQAAVHGESRPLRGAGEMLAHPPVTADAGGVAVELGEHGGSATLAGLAGLARLAAEPLAAVQHTLALVRLGQAEGPDLGGDLAHHLLVRAAHGDRRRRRYLDRDGGGRRVADRVRVAQGQHQVVA